MTNDGTAKDRQLSGFRVRADEGLLTTDQGIRVDGTDDTLRAGERGPSLLQDFHFREKLTHFDHERIPERVVHARGAGAYGYFEPYDASLADVTRARFLTTPGLRTPVFVRFSTVAGSRGSADTVRDVRGFATKFYTEEGNFDLVGNNIPVFFIQDGIKFPDFVHAVKPEPHNEIPQASSAHDTLWDFVQLQPETTHMMMWLMSDRAIPRSYRMMQGFGVHTFRFVDGAGRGTFVKFHWTPRLGVHSLVWDEAQKIAGMDPDYHRRDLWEAIANGDFPEWELGVQLVPEEDEHRFDFDLLDATKLIPEEEVPLRPVGRLVLNRNPDNVFAETEQSAFHLGNVVPGIDVTNDPLLQARLFSYLDTQLIRLGGPNFHQIPVNRPVAPIANHHRDGYHQMFIHQGEAAQHPSSVLGSRPSPASDGSAYAFYPQQVDGKVLRKRAESFSDHYSQATLFWNSMSVWEKKHIVAAFRFELGKVTRKSIREGVVRNLMHVDRHLALAVAEGIGVITPDRTKETHKNSSPALSQAADPVRSVATRRIAILAADGVNASDVARIVEALGGRGAVCEVVSVFDGLLQGEDEETVEVAKTLSTTASVLHDAVYVPGGDRSIATLRGHGEAVYFITEAYKHGKAVAAAGPDAPLLLERAGVDLEAPGVVTGDASAPEFAAAFAEAVAAHRHFERDTEHLPA
jgi:catalase